MMTITVDLSQPQKLFEQLTGIPIDQVARQVGQLGVDLIKANFTLQRSYTGEPWTELSPYTLGRRAKRGNTSTLKLIDTRALFNSVRYYQSQDSVELRVGGAGIEAEKHNLGDPANILNGKPAPIPRRAFVPNETDIPQDWIDKLNQPVNDALNKAIS